MPSKDAVVAVFPDHEKAESAIKTLTKAGFDMKHLSLVGKGFHTEEKVIGFYNVGDRVTFWGTRGAFWGGFWGLFLGGVVLTVPILGQVVILGTLASMVISMVEGAVILGGLSTLAAALYSLNIPENSVVEYETAIKADGFLVMVHGSAEDLVRAKALLVSEKPSKLDTHAGKAEAPASGNPVPATA